MQPSLLKHLVIPAALLATYGCKKEDSKTTEATVNACVPDDLTKTHSSLCTDELIKAHQGQNDGFYCYYESCKLDEREGQPACETYGFSPGITSTPPTREECTFQNPVDL